MFDEALPTSPGRFRTPEIWALPCKTGQSLDISTAASSKSALFTEKVRVSRFSYQCRDRVHCRLWLRFAKSLSGLLIIVVRVMKFKQARCRVVCRIEKCGVPRSVLRCWTNFVKNSIRESARKTWEEPIMAVFPAKISSALELIATSICKAILPQCPPSSEMTCREYRVPHHLRWEQEHREDGQQWADQTDREHDEQKGNASDLLVGSLHDRQ